MTGPEPESFTAAAPDGAILRGDAYGEGPPVVLAHGLTAHRDLVVHGSGAIPRADLRMLTYDARGHGRSDPGEAGGYDYGQLADDLDAVVEGECDSEARPVLVGHSMGAHTIVALALREPERFAGLVIIGPVDTGDEPSAEALDGWDRRAEALERDGVDGFIEVYRAEGLTEQWEETLVRIARQRLEVHEHPDAVAAMLREVPRSRPFGALGELGALQLPCLVVGSQDVPDSGHPLAAAEAYAETLPGARLIAEAEGESPLAWQGGKLSREIIGFCEAGQVAGRHQG